MLYEDARIPLSPMRDNIMSVADAPPPSLQLPVAIKGEQVEGETSLMSSRAGSTVPTEESRSPVTHMPHHGSPDAQRGWIPPSSELFRKGSEGILDLEQEGTPTEASLRSDSPTCPPSVEEGELDGGAEGVAGTSSEQEVPVATIEVDKDAESAIHALLALQREASPLNSRSRTGSPEPHRRRPHSPNLPRQSAIHKGAGGEASRFFCKFPRCGKAYASTDAVRKHCRQRHLDWLRRLGHGCPALYCRWED